LLDLPNIVPNLEAVKNRISESARRAGRGPEEITLVAVTKTIEPARVRRAFDLGIRDFGENRVQEAAPKIAELAIPATWHLVGHLQTNKSRQAVQLFDIVHSIDSLHVALAISHHAEAAGKVMRALLEVNVSGEPQKYGLRPEEVALVAREIIGLPALRVEGLMTVAPVVPEREAARPYFRRLRELRDGLRQTIPAVNWQHLSMGMTDDFEIAIEEGSTMVRIGRAIFGPRPAEIE